MLTVAKCMQFIGMLFLQRSMRLNEPQYLAAREERQAFETRELDCLIIQPSNSASRDQILKSTCFISHKRMRKRKRLLGFDPLN